MRGVLAVLVVLVVLGLGLGVYLQWFGMTMDKEKIKDDTAEARDKVKGVGKQIEDKVERAKEKAAPKGSGGQTATGKVNKVEVADSRFQMTTTDNKDVTVYTNASSALRLKGEEFKLQDLRSEDDVEVAYEVKDGKNLATSVTVNRK